MSCTHRATEERRSCVVPTAHRLAHHSQTPADGRRQSVECLSSYREATYEFDGDLLVVQQVGSLEDDTKGTLANLLPHPVMDADDV